MAYPREQVFPPSIQPNSRSTSEEDQLRKVGTGNDTGRPLRVRRHSFVDTKASTGIRTRVDTKQVLKKTVASPTAYKCSRRLLGTDSTEIDDRYRRHIVYQPCAGQDTFLKLKDTDSEKTLSIRIIGVPLFHWKTTKTSRTHQ